jgi:hypothetical protein
MRVDLVTDRGEPTGGTELPEEILKAFELVSRWMYQHEIRELGTLCCLRVSPREGYLARFPVDKA